MAEEKDRVNLGLVSWREQSTQFLFDQLHNLGIDLDKSHFLAWARESDSPEDLLNLLAPDNEDEEKDSLYMDHLYLILFELWRRFVPERRSLSIVADDIDQTICMYDARGGECSIEEENSFASKMVGYFSEYVRILEASLEQFKGCSPEEKEDVLMEGFTSPEAAIFGMSQPFFAHDIARSFFDFVVEYASSEIAHELLSIIDRIAPFIMPQNFLPAMRVHALWYEDEARAVQQAREFSRELFSKRYVDPVTKVLKQEAIPSVFAFLVFAAKTGESGLFNEIMRNIIQCIPENTQDELFELVSIALLYAETVEHPMVGQLTALLEEMESSPIDPERDLADLSSINRSIKAVLHRMLSH